MRNLFHRSCIICWKKKKDIILSHNCVLLKISLHNFLNTFSPCKHAGFILEHSLAGFPQFGKNVPKNLHRHIKWGTKIIGPRISFFFFGKKITDTVTSLIWRPLYKLTLNFYSLLLSQLPFSSSFESLFHKTNIRDSAVIWAQAFSVAQNVPKWTQNINTCLFSLGTVCTNKFKYLLWNPLSQKRSP